MTAGTPARLFEPWDRKPYDIFFCQVEGQSYCGRKTPIRLRDEQGRQREMKCALVDGSMLCGPVLQEEISEEGVAVYYLPLDEAERLRLLARMASDLGNELRYPFPHLTAGERRERATPVDEWQSSPEEIVELDEGERVLRDWTLEWIAELELEGARVYDPACSSGRFLATLKHHFPAIRAIGQDANQGMVELSRKVLDEVHWGDAETSPVPDGSADFVFCRFLNVDVVTRRRAQELFLPVARRVRPGGRMVVFGHTPVLLGSAWFEAAGFEVERRIGRCRSPEAIFQYYVLRRSGPLRDPEAAWSE